MEKLKDNQSDSPPPPQEKHISNMVIYTYQDIENWLSNTTMAEMTAKSGRSNNSSSSKALICKIPQKSVQWHHLFYVFVKTLGNKDAKMLTPSAVC